MNGETALETLNQAEEKLVGGFFIIIHAIRCRYRFTGGTVFSNSAQTTAKRLSK